ncbi:hypothetical protein CROQUDRAFT_662826 [Cronartium quercuum f. sp. fusiforme G11]|uniref:Uncharacterized protein n=1 Tax=Cronartium quercuum f. sp. fusiforme G11 TaxID=708437 RepID=A0A9P6T875_9BASI|nr:hypothetical protein CROQUDRAFT_662826 [Cronartium quercuum f. sp. fusiforme G11]
MAYEALKLAWSAFWLIERFSPLFLPPQLLPNDVFFAHSLVPGYIDLRSPGPPASIAPVLTGSKFAKGRSRTASSSFSLLAPTTPTDPFPPTPATHGHSATEDLL